MRPLSRAVLATATTFSLCSTAAAEPLAPRLESDVGYELGIYGLPGYVITGVGGTLPLLSNRLELSSGIRLSFGDAEPNPGVGGFVRASLCSVEGSYRPALGLEVEGTTATGAQGDSAEPPGGLSRAYGETNRDNIVRAALVFSPVRFQWGRLFVTFPSLRVATPLGDQNGQRLYAAVLAGGGWSL